MSKKLLISLSLTTLLIPILSLAQENQPPAGGYCPHLYSDVKRGDRDATTGGQVTELQKFLSDYYDLNPDNYVTGYFGRLTQKNVIKFQREQNLPAFGYVGALTRAAIAGVCGGGNVSVNFTASPTSGSAPLAVKFISNVQIPGPYTLDAGSFKIVFGDGQEQVLRCDYTPTETALPGGGVQASLGPLFCAAPPVLHTYTSKGNYSAQLVQSGGYAREGSPSQATMGTVTITVRGTPVPPTPVSCIDQGAFVPVCGHYPGFCPGVGYGACSAPADRTYLNTCELQSAGATLLHSGTCTGQPLQQLLVLSPHGGETLSPGSAITISWQSPRPDSATTHINLSLGSIPQPSPPCTPVTNGNMTTTCSAVGASMQLLPGIITGPSYT